MRITVAARFLAVSLTVLLATVTITIARAQQVRETPLSGGSQMAVPQNPQTGSPVPGTSAASQSPRIATPPRAASVGIPPQVSRQYGPVQQTYSSAWPYVGQKPNGRSAQGRAGPTGASVLVPPTGQRGTSRYPTPLDAGGGGSFFTSQAAAGAMLGARTSSRVGTSSKPFSGYTRRPTTSPYMNLFRTDNSYGRIDNFSTLVRPRLRQRQMNRQTQWELHSLRTSSGTQGTQLRDLNQRTNSIQGTGQPSRFRSVHDYYPGLKR